MNKAAWWQVPWATVLAAGSGSPVPLLCSAYHSNMALREEGLAGVVNCLLQPAPFSPSLSLKRHRFAALQRDAGSVPGDSGATGPEQLTLPVVLTPFQMQK